MKNSKETFVKVQSEAQQFTRRELIVKSLAFSGFVATTGLISACSSSEDANNALDFGLLEADENGLRLLPGFKSRLIARSSQRVLEGSEYIWHGAPDGGACFPQEDGGWIYVSNAELSSSKGGVGAIRFDAAGDIVDAYEILSNTNRNCAGGASPWGTWLSCEEDGDDGRVFECDPTGEAQAKEVPLFGKFNHEAVAYDLNNHHLYLTEDTSDGCLYRFVPASFREDGFADIYQGHLEVAEVFEDGGKQRVRWHRIVDPSASSTSTRKQVSEASEFKGGEGIVYESINGQGNIYFTTKGDNRVWRFQVEANELSIVYDYATSENNILKGVDNIIVDPKGNLIIAEDEGTPTFSNAGKNMQVISIDRQGILRPIVQIVGHRASEVTGIAFSPDFSRFYFSSQRGTKGKNSDGYTFEVMGPFA